MLPGTVPALSGGKPPPTYGVDLDTISLVKFSEARTTGSSVAVGVTFNDYVKTTTPWSITQSGGSYSTGVHCGCGSFSTNNVGKLRSAADAAYDALFGGDFTIDCWLWLNDVSTTFADVIGKYVGSGAYGPFVLRQEAATLRVYSASADGSWGIVNSWVAISGVQGGGGWNHYAIQRKGTSWSSYWNGVGQSTITAGGTPVASTQGFTINAGTGWSGSIAMLRLSKVARYSGTFNWSREPYFGVLNGNNDDATTTLLHCDSTTENDQVFVDSAFGQAWGETNTGIGGCKQTAASAKFGARGMALSGAVGDRLPYAASMIDQQLGAWGNWTIDFWAKTNGTAGSFLQNRNTTAQWTSVMLLDNGGGALRLYVSFDNASWFLNSANVGTVTVNTWNHIAIVCDRSAGAIKVYVNGTLTYTSSGIGNFPMTYLVQPFCIGGCSNVASIVGAIDEFRISSVARWTANFTPPSGPY